MIQYTVEYTVNGTDWLIVATGEEPGAGKLFAPLLSPGSYQMQVRLTADGSAPVLSDLFTFNPVYAEQAQAVQGQSCAGGMQFLAVCQQLQAASVQSVAGAVVCSGSVVQAQAGQSQYATSPAADSGTVSQTQSAQAEAISGTHNILPTASIVFTGVRQADVYTTSQASAQAAQTEAISGTHNVLPTSTIVFSGVH